MLSDLLDHTETDQQFLLKEGRSLTNESTVVVGTN